MTAQGRIILLLAFMACAAPRVPFAARAESSHAASERNEAHLRALFDRKPTDTGIALALADAYSADRAAGTKEKATTVIQRNALAHSSAVAYAELARLRGTDFVACEKDARTAIGIDTNYPYAWYLLSFALRNQGEFELALDAVDHHLQLNSLDPYGFEERARNYAALGRRKEAIADLEVALQRSIDIPQRFPVSFLVGLSELYAGDASSGNTSARLLKNARTIRGDAPAGFLTPVAPNISATPLPEPCDRRINHGLELAPHSTLVSCVRSGSCAADAGILAGDRVVSIDGNLVRELSDIEHALLGQNEGEWIEFTIVRNGETLDRKSVAKSFLSTWLEASKFLLDGDQAARAGDERGACLSYAKASDRLDLLWIRRAAAFRLFASSNSGPNEIAVKKEYIRNYLAFSPRDPALSFTLAHMELRSGNTRTARDLATKALELCPADGGLAAFLGRTWIAEGNRSVAISWLDRAISLGKCGTQLGTLARSLDLQKAQADARRKQESDQFATAVLAALAGERAPSNGSNSYDPNAPQYQPSYYGAQQPLAIQAQQDMANMMWVH